LLFIKIESNVTERRGWSSSIRNNLPTIFRDWNSISTCSAGVGDIIVVVTTGNICLALNEIILAHQSSKLDDSKKIDEHYVNVANSGKRCRIFSFFCSFS
jgi:hypothetical protein